MDGQQEAERREVVEIETNMEKKGNVITLGDRVITVPVLSWVQVANGSEGVGSRPLLWVLAMAVLRVWLPWFWLVLFCSLVFGLLYERMG